MRELSGRNAFVTGGASGIGLATCEALLAEGVRVVVVDHSEANLESARPVLESLGEVLLLTLDVTDREAYAAAADAAEQRFGAIHLLVNNAGVGVTAPMTTATHDDWDRMLAVNLGGVVNGVVEVVPRIRRHGEGGHVVNTASMAGIIPMLDAGGIYTTSKFAVRGLSESLRLALVDDRIGVSCLCPGLTRTRILDPTRDRLDGGDAVADDPVNAVFAEAQASAMDPADVARGVVDAIRENAAYVIVHSEFVDEIEELHRELLGAVRHDVPVAPGRLAVEDERRRLVRETKARMASW